MGASASTGRNPNAWYTLEEVKDIVGNAWTNKMEERFKQEVIVKIFMHSASYYYSGCL